MKPQRFPKVSLRKLSHEQIRTVLQRIVDQWEGRETIPPTIQLLLNDILEQLAILDKILLREEANTHTKAINELDDLRDRAYKLLVKKVRASQDEFDQNLINAGVPLLPIIKKFNWEITKKSYTEQTTLTNLAISEFRKEEHTQHLNTLELLPHLERVEQFNNQFETLWNERSEAEATKEDLPPLRDVRTQLESRSALLFKNCEYLFGKNHDAVDDSLFTIIDSELTKVSSTVKMRETIAENAEVSAL